MFGLYGVLYFQYCSALISSTARSCSMIARTWHRSWKRQTHNKNKNAEREAETIDTESTKQSCWNPHTIPVCVYLYIGLHYSPQELFSGNYIVSRSLHHKAYRWYSQFSHVPTESSAMKQMLRRFASKWQHRYGYILSLFLFPFYFLSMQFTHCCCVLLLLCHRNHSFILSCSIFKRQRFDTFPAWMQHWLSFAIAQQQQQK